MEIQKIHNIEKTQIWKHPDGRKIIILFKHESLGYKSNYKHVLVAYTRRVYSNDKYDLQYKRFTGKNISRLLNTIIDRGFESK